MTQGWFLVDIRPTQPDEVALSLLPDAPSPLPDDQKEVWVQVEQLQAALQLAFPMRATDGKLNPAYAPYFEQLRLAAAIGLSGPVAHTDIALRLLAILRDNISLREGGTAKNRYMRRLGWWALSGAAICTGLGSLACYRAWPCTLVHLCWFLAACMPGIWVSFGARKTSFGFADVIVPEADRLHPIIRVLFVGLLATGLALLTISKAVEIKVGDFNPANWTTDVVTAVLFGFACGFSEQVLATSFGQQAAKIFDLK